MVRPIRPPSNVPLKKSYIPFVGKKKKKREVKGLKKNKMSSGHLTCYESLEKKK
jgi:hypothetical protein